MICTVKSKLPYGATCVVEKCFAVLTGVICNICVILCEVICAGEVWNDLFSTDEAVEESNVTDKRTKLV